MTGKNCVNQFSLIKLVYIVVVAICFFGCLLCGCAKKHKEVQSEASVEAPTNTVSNLQKLNNYEEQLDIILEKKDVWKLNESYSGDFCEAVDLANSSGFAVTDLDEDGYLEIIKSGYLGSGHYSVNFIYELTDDGNMIEWNISEFEKYDSQPDLYFLDNVSKHEDDSGKTYYIVEDLIKDGTAFTENRYFSMKIENNKVELDMLGYTENKEGTVAYYIDNVAVTDQAWTEWKDTIMTDCDVLFDLVWFSEISKDNLQKSCNSILAN